ncbi:hypothetical protein CLPUN_32950 [Clostridium puniceum]|uniref:Uncharacterized protein n=1 Tax=Clostridium puniceum TaxID=29367 RepID=A0A1S8TCK9_9CLOT|nr:hypothetical protein [Clostridium puniceum]OOM75349.1 hypothetical protein CLPUN_32950 [Clostridium puniceum]
MIDFNNYEDDIKFQNYEFSSIPYESYERQRPPFFQGPGSNNFPPDFDSQPGFNFPGGVFNPPGMPKSPPPNYTPSKNAAGVQKFNSGGGGIETKAVSSNSIRFCLYKFTYIWERNGRNYWAFLLNVDRRSVSGFRWTGRNWIYFGIDLRRIDSFVCYRSEFNENCNNCTCFREDNVPLIENKKDYLLNETKDVYTQTLSSIDVPEVKEDFITHTIGYIDDVNIKSDIPCVKLRNICHKITLEVTYPNTYNESLKNEINKLAHEASIDADKIFSSSRSYEKYSNSLELFNSYISLIPEALNNFSKSFSYKLNLLNLSSDDYSNITYSIRNEKICNDWKPYFSTL